MDLAFDSIPLRTICESEEVAVRELGPEVAKALRSRLADLRAATSINDIVVGHPREMEFGENHQPMIIDLYDNCILVVSANHPRNPIKKDGKIDWQNVTRVKILGIERDL